MKFLNGWKTLLGILTTAAAVIVPSVGGDASLVPAVSDQVGNIVEHGSALVAGIGATLTTLGLIHKVEKKRAAG